MYHLNKVNKTLESFATLFNLKIYSENGIIVIEEVE